MAPSPSAELEPGSEVAARPGDHRDAEGGEEVLPIWDVKVESAEQAGAGEEADAAVDEAGREAARKRHHPTKINSTKSWTHS